MECVALLQYNWTQCLLLCIFWGLIQVAPPYIATSLTRARVFRKSKQRWVLKLWWLILWAALLSWSSSYCNFSWKILCTSPGCESLSVSALVNRFKTTLNKLQNTGWPVWKCGFLVLWNLSLQTKAFHKNRDNTENLSISISFIPSN